MSADKELKNSVMFGCRYLGSEIVKNIPRNWDISESFEATDYLLSSGRFDELWHFSCVLPDSSKSERGYRDSLYHNLQITKRLIETCNTLGVKLIYAGSKGSKHIKNPNSRQQLYNCVKWMSEDMIIEFSKDYLILEIPRVYSSNRPTGLIRTLRRNEFVGSMDSIVEFQDLSDFVLETSTISNTKKIHKYKHNLQKLTIKEIESKYILKRISNV